jgi:hypothetical protein
MGTRERAAQIDFSGVLEEEVEGQLKEAAQISMGTEISGEDLDNILALCDQVGATGGGGGMGMEWRVRGPPEATQQGVAPWASVCSEGRCDTETCTVLNCLLVGRVCDQHPSWLMHPACELHQAPGPPLGLTRLLSLSPLPAPPPPPPPPRRS